MKLQVKFDFIQNLEKQKEEATEEDIREYKENPDEFIKQAIEGFKEILKNELSSDDYYWIENLDVKVVEGESGGRMTFEELKELVLDWANDKDLLYEENGGKQFLKFIEEVFEFKTEMDKNLDGQVTIDSKVKQAFFRGEIGVHDLLQNQKMDMGLEMGDILVTLIILCNQLGIDPIECLGMAYEKISKRKGKTVDGVFVKEEDLK